MGGKIFKFMVLIFLENALNIVIFTHTNQSQSEGNYSFTTGRVFQESVSRFSRKGCRKL